MRNQMIWCRVALANGEYHYVLTNYQMALALCIKQGYEINIDASEVPEKFKRQYE
jgi:hypothetical protein